MSESRLTRMKSKRNSGDSADAVESGGAATKRPAERSILASSAEAKAGKSGGDATANRGGSGVRTRSENSSGKCHSVAPMYLEDEEDEDDDDEDDDEEEEEKPQRPQRSKSRKVYDDFFWPPVFMNLKTLHKKEENDLRKAILLSLRESAAHRTQRDRPQPRRNEQQQKQQRLPPLTQAPSSAFTSATAPTKPKKTSASSSASSSDSNRPSTPNVTVTLHRCDKLMRERSSSSASSNFPRDDFEASTPSSPAGSECISLPEDDPTPAEAAARAVRAQRKFASNDLNAAHRPSTPSSPIATPTKTIGAVAAPSLTQRPSHFDEGHRPRTRDLLTFLCLRGTPALPPHLEAAFSPTSSTRDEIRKPPTEPLSVQAVRRNLTDPAPSDSLTISSPSSSSYPSSPSSMSSSRLLPDAQEVLGSPRPVVAAADAQPQDEKTSDLSQLNTAENSTCPSIAFDRREPEIDAEEFNSDEIVSNEEVTADPPTDGTSASPSVPSRISRRIQAKLSCYFERQKRFMRSDYEDQARSDKDEPSSSKVDSMMDASTTATTTNRRRRPETDAAGLQQNSRRKWRDQQKQRISALKGPQLPA